jgi:large subunit ribosomal protein L5
MATATATSTGTKRKNLTNGPASNPMRTIKISKITLNVGAGKSEEQMKKAVKLFQKLTSLKSVETVAKKRIPTWGLRPGLAIGCKVTIREGAQELLRRLLVAKENKLSVRNFDNQGNFAFGLAEYIDIEGLTYDPELKIMGMEIAVTLERPGYRVKRKKIRKSKVGRNQQITKEEAIAFVKKMGVEVE